METPMRALALCIALAACSAPIPDVTREQITANLDEPAPSPADNIAAIGAQGLCERPEQAVTERQSVAVTHCDAATP